MGAASKKPSCLSRTNGLLPTLAPQKYKPTSIVARQNWAKLTMVITGASQVFAFQIRIHPNIQCQNVHNIKLPSWPSQKQLNRYSTCSALLLCCQAYLYSNKWLEIMK